MKGLTPLRAAAATLLLACAAAVPMLLTTAAAGPNKGNAALGKTVFAKNCVLCHKIDGSGGMKLTGNATPNWKDAKVWADPKRANDDFFRNCITNGNLKSGMVAWGKQLKSADIENLIAHIHTFKPRK